MEVWRGREVREGKPQLKIRLVNKMLLSTLWHDHFIKSSKEYDFSYIWQLILDAWIKSSMPELVNHNKRNG